MSRRQKYLVPIFRSLRAHSSKANQFQGLTAFSSCGDFVLKKLRECYKISIGVSKMNKIGCLKN